MKKILAIGFFLLFYTPASHSAITLQQTVEGKNTSGSTLNVAVDPTAAGSLLVITDFIGSNFVTTVTDNKGSKWHRANNILNAVQGDLELWYASNTVVGVATVTISANNAGVIHAEFYEFYGVLTSSATPLDQALTADVTSASPQHGPTITPLESGEVFVTNAMFVSSNITAVSSPFTYIAPTFNTYPYNAYYISTTSSSQQPAWTSGGSQEVYSIMATFRAAPAPLPTIPTTMELVF